MIFKNKKSNLTDKYERVPLWSKIAIILCGICIILYIIICFNPRFADTFNLYVGSFFRFLFALISNIFPFSLGELLVVLSPLIVLSVIVTAAKKKGIRERVRFLSGFLAIVSLFYTSYVFMLGVGYQRTALNSRLGIPVVKITEPSSKTA